MGEMSVLKHKQSSAMREISKNYVVLFRNKSALKATPLRSKIGPNFAFTPPPCKI